MVPLALRELFKCVEYFTKIPSVRKWNRCRLSSASLPGRITEKSRAEGKDQSCRASEDTDKNKDGSPFTSYMIPGYRIFAVVMSIPRILTLKIKSMKREFLLWDISSKLLSQIIFLKVLRDETQIPTVSLPWNRKEIHQHSEFSVIQLWAMFAALCPHHSWSHVTPL